MKDLLAKFPYKSTFLSQAKVVTPKEEDRFLALASLDNLKGILPEGIDTEGNPDLLYIASNLFVAGMANRNGDAITNEDAIKLTPLFINKFLDIEHKREKIAGAIISSGFSAYGSNEVIAANDIADYDKPFNMAYGAVIWKLIYSQLADLLIESSDENSDKYNVVSSSWEIGFRDFDIAVGSKFVNDAELVTDEKHKEELFSKYLSKGGMGTKDGENVYRVLRWPQIAIGAGLVRNPAAHVQGVTLLAEKEETEEEPEEPEEVEEEAAEEVTDTPTTEPNESVEEEEDDTISPLIAKIISEYREQKSKEISQSKKQGVKTHYTTMKIEDLYKLLQEQGGEEVVASAKDLFADEIKKASEQYVADIEAKETELNDVKAKQEEAEKTLQEVREELEALKEGKAEIEKRLREAQKAEQTRAFNERFQTRMEELNEEYELEDEDREAVASFVRDLDDEAYVTWKEKTFAVLAKNKNKEVIAKAKEQQEATASADTPEETDEVAEDVVDDALASAKPTDDAPINPAPGGENNSLREKFAAAFGEDSYEFVKR